MGHQQQAGRRTSDNAQACELAWIRWAGADNPGMTSLCCCRAQCGLLLLCYNPPQILQTAFWCVLLAAEPELLGSPHHQRKAAQMHAAHVALQLLTLPGSGPPVQQAAAEGEHCLLPGLGSLLPVHKQSIKQALVGSRLAEVV